MNKIQIGGKTFSIPNGSSISIKNGKVIVDGKLLESTEPLRPIYVEVYGDVKDLKTNNTATIHGSVTGSVEAGNTVECGDVGGNVEAGNSVHARHIKGNVKAGNSIHKSFSLNNL